MEKLEVWLRRAASMLGLTPKGLIALVVLMAGCIFFGVYTMQYATLPYLTHP